VKLPEKSKLIENLPGKIDFFTRINDAQISNQIDAADSMCLNSERKEQLADVIYLIST